MYDVVGGYECSGRMVKRTRAAAIVYEVYLSNLPTCCPYTTANRTSDGGGPDTLDGVTLAM